MLHSRLPSPRMATSQSFLAVLNQLRLGKRNPWFVLPYLQGTMMDSIGHTADMHM